ncbi:hypothetical protein [Macromonas nakdongensis]|uniref:hypothetical protein n=1 Tax=Macromonas nakdongensis TaxID=1843082 RepID=UPI0018E30556|nr:hypothetical protein [Macromonas nakdongensis]
MQTDPGVYAQKFAAGLRPPSASPPPLPEQTIPPKLLILLNKTGCVFSGHSKQGLDFQGLAREIQQLSTKLSTENLGKCWKFLQINDLPVFPPT